MPVKAMVKINTNRVFVAGHLGIVGSAFVQHFESLGAYELVTVSKDELDLRDQAAVYGFLRRVQPDLVIVAAAKVGGIYPNKTVPAQFLYDNIAIVTNLIEGSHRADIDRLMFLGSHCIYPRDCVQPIPETALLTGPLEPTNEAYALAKIAGI